MAFLRLVFADCVGTGPFATWFGETRLSAELGLSPLRLPRKGDTQEIRSRPGVFNLSVAQVVKGREAVPGSVLGYSVRPAREKDEVATDLTDDASCNRRPAPSERNS